MVARSLTFFEKYGPITKDGFTFEGGYTNVITAGDGDFLTADTLWDFKVSKNGLTSAQTLQLLIYYIMGEHSIYEDFDSIKRLGVFNPRQNCVYLKEIADVSSEVITKVSTDVIGYNQSSTGNKLDEDSLRDEMLSLTDVMRILSCSRYTVMKYLSEDNLPLTKTKNRYMISRNDLQVWLEAKAEQERRQRKAQFIGIMIIIIIAIAFILFYFPSIQDLLFPLRNLQTK